MSDTLAERIKRTRAVFVRTIELEAEIERLRAENEELKAQTQSRVDQIHAYYESLLKSMQGDIDALRANALTAEEATYLKGEIIGRQPPAWYKMGFNERDALFAKLQRIASQNLHSHKL